MAKYTKSSNPENDDQDFEVSSSASSSISMMDALEFIEANHELIPWGDLVSNNWLKSKEDIATLATIISSTVLNKESSSALFRKNENTDTILVDLWTKKVETTASNLLTNYAFNEIESSPISHDYLLWLAELSTNPKILIDLPEILHEQNIILIYEKALPGIKTDGIVFTLHNGTPVIGMSLRYSRLDYFWFTLLHELSHIILHYDQLRSGIVEDLDSQSTELIEIQANTLARDTIVPRYLRGRSEPWFNQTPDKVYEFAHKVQRHPALIAGQVHFDQGKWNTYADIVNEHDIRNIIYGD